MASGGKGILKAAFTPLAKYPVATTAATGVVSMGFLLQAALQKGDPGLVIASLLGIVGQAALMATDNNVKAFAKPQQQPLPDLAP